MDTAGTYTYTVTAAGTPSCTSTATVVVTTISEPNAGTDNTVNLCRNGGLSDLYDSLGGTPDLGGTWTPTLNSGSGLFDPLIDTAGTYTYTVNATLPCRGSSSAILTVNIIQEPDASGALLTAENICLGLENTVNLSNAVLLVDGSYTNVAQMFR